ncbi:MAG TPA: helix-turn-helix domain-containing protein, partial [Burkholderiales bacterium]|nr:helix-turn-helix domain-containing protein [Burkholderiales bacterium]
VASYLLSCLPRVMNGSPAVAVLPAKKGIIASRLNLTHEHFSRILRELTAAGLIEVRGRDVIIRDVGRLRARYVR